jgi:hypothetical protein
MGKVVLEGESGRVNKDFHLSSCFVWLNFVLNNHTPLVSVLATGNLYLENLTIFVCKHVRFERLVGSNQCILN